MNILINKLCYTKYSKKIKTENNNKINNRNKCNNTK